MARLLLVIILVAGCGLSAAEDEPRRDWITFNEFVEASIKDRATISDLIAVLRNPDPAEVEFAIRFSARRCKPLDVVPVYEAVWNAEEAVYPSLDFAHLRHPIIRLAVASALGRLRGDAGGSLRAYVLEQLEEREPDTLPYAILAFGNVGRVEDVDLLVREAKLDDGEYVFQAAHSLLEIDPALAHDAFGQLRGHFGHSSWQAGVIRDIESTQPVDCRPCRSHGQNSANKSFQPTQRSCAAEA